MLLLVLACFTAAPFTFSSTILWYSATLFLAWLGTFKVIILVAKRRSHDPASLMLHFILASALLVELTSTIAWSPKAAPTVTMRSKAEQVECLASCALKVNVTAIMLLLNQ
jgi:hypothetical protein